jgi:uncharacterized RDD family membrane protein YckC
MPLEVAVLSPEKTVLTYRLSGLGSRFAAHLIDFLIIIATLIGLGMLAGWLSTILPILSTVTNGILFTTFALFPFAYFIFLEGLWNGQTVGKKLGKIRVRMADGTPITFAASTARNFLRVADFLPLFYFLGMCSLFVNPKMQRIGDLIAGTIVTNEDKIATNFSVAPHRVGIHPLEHLVGELRNMSDDQYAVLRRYCDRFPNLPLVVQNQLTETVWLPMAKRLSVPMTPDIHPIYLAEATVMKYGRVRGLL